MLEQSRHVEIRGGAWQQPAQVCAGTVNRRHQGIADGSERLLLGMRQE